MTGFSSGSAAGSSRRLQLLDEDEFAEGLARAEHELPAEIEAEQYLLAVVGERER